MIASRHVLVAVTGGLFGVTLVRSLFPMVFERDGLVVLVAVLLAVGVAPLVQEIQRGRMSA